MILLLLATLGRAFAGSLATLLSSTVTVGAGLAIAGALVGGFIKAAYTGRAALATGVYAVAPALGSTIAAAASSPLTQAFGSWRVGIGAWAIPVCSRSAHGFSSRVVSVARRGHLNRDPTA
ncbi:hypothetical protein [Acidisoma sp. L85]|uniref:hypothetical protein n=1 Tax=Acidisoma sp. L85 TaxID=1641850 RepID=UPI001C20B8DE|nr:hypothetical protein [Acidisoma sp. L85]